MQKYQQNPLIIDAVQFTDDMVTGKLPLPEEVKSAVCDSLKGELFYIKGEHRKQLVEVGDWIVRYPDGKLSVIPNSVFVGLYSIYISGY